MTIEKIDANSIKLTETIEKILPKDYLISKKASLQAEINKLDEMLNLLK